MTTTILTPGNVAGLKTRKASDDKSLPTIVIYGGSGTGKTTLAASACEVEAMSPILILNVENGTQSIREIYPDVDVLDIDTLRDLQKTYNYLYDHTDLVAQTCAGYKTIILDNLTETQSRGIEHIFGEDKQGRVSFAQFDTATFGNHGWSMSSDQMRKLIRGFRNLSCYVILCAWEMDYSKKDNQHLWTPAFTRTLAGEAPGFVQDVYRLHFTREGERALQTSHDNSTVAKDRSRKLPKLMLNPTMSLIHQYWTGALVKPPDEATNQSKMTLKMRKP